ncbi:MAG: gamma-glutamyltransferase family protein, partial [Rhodospirillaceae bacterium]|nr:gamma-glutamyltransferase family protein [Rhodospirillaceae bacterium]
TIAEALKLAFADRERLYTDPAQIAVPLDRLLSDHYAAERRALIRPGEAWPEMPPPGELLGGLKGGPQGPDLDTSYVAVVDRQGNAFSATPSDTSYSAPVVPGTGLVPSSRGSQSWADPDHPRAVAPGHRPRLTPNPALALRDGAYVMPFGTPGGDVQVQAMVQTFLNLEVYGMDPQQAVEAPRFAMHSFPNSFEPHAYYPGRLTLEQPLFDAHGANLAKRGHKPEAWAAGTWRAGGMCLVRHDLKRGILEGAADPRRPSYALGW